MLQPLLWIQIRFIRALLDLDPQDIFKSNFHPLIINLKVQVPTGSFR